MWIPLAFWAIHRVFDSDHPVKWGLLAGVFLSLQFLSCVYYGVFLAMLMIGLGVLLTATDLRRARTVLPVLMLGAAMAVALSTPYLLMYRLNVSTVGLRPVEDVGRFSAQPVDYLLAPAENQLLGGTADTVGNEKRLYPGLVACLIGLAALLYRPRKLVFVYAALFVLAIELSFGLNGPLYQWLHTHINSLHALRAPARFAILAQCALAVLAGLGVCAILQGIDAPRPRGLLVAGLLALLTVDYASSTKLVEVADKQADVYTIVRLTGPGVVVDLPMPHLTSLPQWDAIYESWSAKHWHPLVNGYSGFYPPGYYKTVALMESFPSDASIARLRELHVRYIVVHRLLLDTEAYLSLIDRMRQRRELLSGGIYSDPMGESQLFELR
jgi:hypothetical protein